MFPRFLDCVTRWMVVFAIKGKCWRRWSCFNKVVVISILAAPEHLGGDFHQTFGYKNVKLWGGLIWKCEDNGSLAKRIDRNRLKGSYLV